QATVEEIPQDVKCELLRSPCRVVHRCSVAHAGAHMLALVECELYFRDDVPVCCGSGDEITFSEELHHRCPCSANAAVLCEHLSRCASPIKNAGSFCRVGGQLKSGLDLKEARARKILSKGREGFKGRCARAQASLLVSRWRSNFTLQAEDGTRAFRHQNP